MADTKYYDEGGVRVTSTNLVVNGVVYPLGAMVAAGVEHQPVHRLGPLLLFFFSALGVFNNLYWIMPLVLAVVWWRRQKEAWAVRVSWDHEEKLVYKSENSEVIHGLVAALQKALEEGRATGLFPPPEKTRGWSRLRLKFSQFIHGRMTVARGCGCLTVLFVLGLAFAIYNLTFRKYPYNEAAYYRDYTWGNVEVGVVLRYPIGSFVPIGRYWAVVAIPKGQTNQERILFKGPKGEVPPALEFVSGAGSSVTYRVPEDGRPVTLDLTNWQTNELRSASSTYPMPSPSERSERK